MIVPCIGGDERVRGGRGSGVARRAARVLELRREGLSVHEISARLRAGGIPLNRTGVGQILAEEGFARLLRSPAPAASTSPATPGRDTQLARAAVIDFAAFPARTETRLAGLLLALPDLVSLDAPALIAAAGYPGTSVIPAASWLPPPPPSGWASTASGQASGSGSADDGST
jgi:hypothetical protein